MIAPWSGLPMLNRKSWGACPIEQHVTTGMSLAFASASGFASASLSIAVLMMASVPSRIADCIAFWTFSGVPSVATTLTFHPRVAAPSLTSLPWNTQVSMPQLIQVTFFPVGIGLSIFFVWVICVGRLYAVSTSFLASSSLAEDDAPPEALSPPPSSPPHPAASSMAARAGTKATPRRRRVACLAVVWNTVVSSSSVSMRFQ